MGPVLRGPSAHLIDLHNRLSGSTCQPCHGSQAHRWRSWSKVSPTRWAVLAGAPVAVHRLSTATILLPWNLRPLTFMCPTSKSPGAGVWGDAHHSPRTPQTIPVGFHTRPRPKGQLGFRLPASGTRRGMGDGHVSRRQHSKQPESTGLSRLTSHLSQSASPLPGTRPAFSNPLPTAVLR